MISLETALIIILIVAVIVYVSMDMLRTGILNMANTGNIIGVWSVQLPAGATAGPQSPVLITVNSPGATRTPGFVDCSGRTYVMTSPTTVTMSMAPSADGSAGTVLMNGVVAVTKNVATITWTAPGSSQAMTWTRG